jgi:hypothetical protein
MGFFSDAAQAAYSAEIIAEGIEDAVSEMEGMVGNAGQETIVEQGIDGFYSWAENGANGTLDSSQLGISGEAYDGTSEIWSTGEEIVRDAYDEAGQASEEGDGGDDEDGSGNPIIDWLVDLFTDSGAGD